MSEKKIKWGFIGCGEVTKYKSGPAFQKVEGSEVIAVMSRDGAKAKAYAKERGIPKWYDDAQELIDDEDVNAIYIATPPSSHATYAIMAMKAGKPVYIEKPMAVTYEECCRINRISNETGVPCFVAYYRRYLPYFLKVKELIENGSIGNVINVQIRFAQPPHFHSHPDSNPDVPPLLLPDNPSSGLAPTLAMNAVAIPSVYPLLSHGSPSRPHSKFRCYGHCSPSRGHRPSRPGVWIGYRRCGGRRNDSLRHQNHGGGERYPSRAR